MAANVLSIIVVADAETLRTAPSALMPKVEPKH